MLQSFDSYSFLDMYLIIFPGHVKIIVKKIDYIRLDNFAY